MLVCDFVQILHFGPTAYLSSTALCSTPQAEENKTTTLCRTAQKQNHTNSCYVAEDYLSLLGLSGGDSSGQALPSILFLASAYSASRWARDLICGVGLFWPRGDPSEPLLTGRFRMRI